ncbi:MAG: hypothetical protein PHN35_07225 [Clostridia bacterium]|nr:hypothetical protein [Clostridia bacterium]MDD4799345.1 hypothetical protein [Clostridia bacterium]
MEKIWTIEEIILGYQQTAQLNLQIAEEFEGLEVEADELILSVL